MSAETRRLHLRFSMQRPEQAKAYETLSAIPPRQRMEYLSGVINQASQCKDIEEHIINAVKQALSAYQLQIPALPSKEENEAGEIREDIMDFLASL